MPGAHDWTIFTADDLTQPVTMLASVPPSDGDVPVMVEPEPEVTTGFLGRRKERLRGVQAMLWLANGYGKGDEWHAYLSYPESAPFERLGVRLPKGSWIVSTTKNDAEVRLPLELSPHALLEFALEACTQLAAEPLPGQWRACIPNMSSRTAIT